jgi:ATP-dependent DNA helicase RecG
VLPADDPKAARSVAPVYAARAPLKPDKIDDAVRIVLEALPPGAGGALPARAAAAAGLGPWRPAVAALHDPATPAAAAAARRRVALEELIVMELALARARSAGAPADGPAVEWGACRVAAAAATAALPFTLTPGQAAALDDVLADMAPGARPMARLLQGDVGSGKTAVALAALAAAVGGGAQAALMAPTEVLAAQLHANVLALNEALPEGSRMRVALLTGSTPRSERVPALTALATGALDVAVGTHALAGDSVAFKMLGLAVVDEQHRFGVAQRAALASKAPPGRPPPHVLSMSATPIPRTLALVASGEAAVSVVEGRPPGRGVVRTAVVLDDDSGRAAVAAAVKAAVAAGGRAFVVCPRVEADAVGGLRAAEEEAATLRASGALGDGVEIGLLHGRLPPADKAAALAAFREGAVQVLISTTVVEVGVDVPEATVMVVEGADRFGLAQLHQLRGRVGRGGADGSCFLMARDAASAARLAVLAASDDGFVIAEADLADRGPGEFLGTRQSGRASLGGLRAARLPNDLDLLPRARRMAAALRAALPDDAGAWPPGLAAAVAAFATGEAAAAATDAALGSADADGLAAAVEPRAAAPPKRRGRPPKQKAAAAAA